MIMVTKYEKTTMDTFRENSSHKNYMFKVTGPRSKDNEAKNLPMHNYPLKYVKGSW